MNIKFKINLYFINNNNIYLEIKFAKSLREKMILKINLKMFCMFFIILDDDDI